MKKALITAIMAISIIGISKCDVYALNKNVDNLNKEAYNAVKISQDEKTQKSINDARKAIKNLKNYSDSSQIISMVSTYSSLVDKIQQEILSNIVRDIEYAKSTGKQISVNWAYSTLPKELMDLEGTSNKDYWKHAYSSYKVAIDEVQLRIQKALSNTIKLAQKSRKIYDIEGAIRLLEEIEMSENNSILNWAKEMKKRIDEIIYSDEFVDITKQIIESNNADELKIILDNKKDLFDCYKEEDIEEYFNIVQERKIDIDNILHVDSIISFISTEPCKSEAEEAIWYLNAEINQYLYRENKLEHKGGVLRINYKGQIRETPLMVDWVDNARNTVPGIYDNQIIESLDKMGIDSSKYSIHSDSECQSGFGNTVVFFKNEIYIKDKNTEEVFTLEIIPHEFGTYNDLRYMVGSNILNIIVGDIQLESFNKVVENHIKNNLNEDGTVNLARYKSIESIKELMK